MSIAIKVDADSRQNLGDSGVLQQGTGSFSLSDYPTGGYPIYAIDFGMSAIRSLIPCGYTGTTEGYVFQYEQPAVAGPAQTNPGHLKMFIQNGGTGALAEASANTNISSGTISLLAFGY